MSDERRNKLMQLRSFKEWYENKDDRPENPKLSWNQKLELCIEYEESHNKGDIRIKTDTIYRGIPIGKWIGIQKESIKGKGTGKMT